MTSIQKRLDKMEIQFDLEEFVVLDIGTGFIKAGFSGEDLPRVVIPTCIGEMEKKIEEAQGGQTMEVKAKTLYEYGNGAIANAPPNGEFKFFEPVERGVVQDLDRLEKLLDHIFTNELKVKTSSMNLLMTDAPGNSKEKKKALCDLMFEKFKIASFSLQNTASLSLFSTGTTTGLVAECGHGLSYAVPVFEGFALPHAIHRIEIAGQDITMKLMKEIQNGGESRLENHHAHLVREMKEQMCHVSMNYESESKSRDDVLNQEQRSYELPSGEIIEVDQRKRIAASEIIFDPRYCDNQEQARCEGIAQIAFNAIEKCDPDLKINLYNNIVLAGGTTLMNGFTDRFD